MKVLVEVSSAGFLALFAGLRATSGMFGFRLQGTSFILISLRFTAWAFGFGVGLQT